MGPNVDHRSAYLAKFSLQKWPKISFLSITHFMTILGPMFLHKLNINMIIAVLLVNKLSRYDLPNPSYKKS